MTRVYISDAELEHHRALRLLLLDLTMKVAGEAATLATRWALRSGGTRGRNPNSKARYDQASLISNHLQRSIK